MLSNKVSSKKAIRTAQQRTRHELVTTAEQMSSVQ